MKTRFRVILVVAGLLTASATAQFAAPTVPQDSGPAALEQRLRKVQTTGRLLHVTAHPDDEDGALLTYYSRTRGVETMLLCLTRGEGGQNKIGSGLSDELGLLRTLELLASTRYYGTQLRFSRLIDFGYSKSADESFAKWGGKEVALGEVVRAVREFRPQVIVSRFSGTRADGHGHHEAAGILAREAFRAAADPKRFPEQIAAGLAPWQAQKLYIGVRGSPEYTVEIDVGLTDAALGGLSPAELAMKGLKHQLSQGAETWQLGAGPKMRRYRMVESALGALPSREADMFEGIDTSLPSLAKSVPAAATPLREAQSWIARVVETKGGEGGLLALRAIESLKNSERAAGTTATKEFRDGVQEKQEQLGCVADLASGITAEATALTCSATKPEKRDNIVAGDEVCIRETLRNDGANKVMVTYATVNANTQHWEVPEELGIDEVMEPGTELSPQIRVRARNAELTRPQHRRNEATPNLYAASPDPAVPLAAPPLAASAEYKLNRTSSRIMNSEVPAPGAPAYSVSIEPHVRIVPVSSTAPLTFTVVQQRARDGLAAGNVTMNAPNGWTTKPVDGSAGPNARVFSVSPQKRIEGIYKVSASVQVDGTTYGETVTRIGRTDLGWYPFYRPAEARVHVIDVRVPSGLKVGYIQGSGDEIADVLRQIGVEVTEIKPEEIASGDLSPFDTIVVGIRAYDTRPDVRTHNKRLLDYANAGGNLVVQYNADFQEFNDNKLTPFAAAIGRQRVSVEEAPVTVLAPADPLFRAPNKITARDFDGWVQERGLYFLQSWEAPFEPLLSMSDPGEEALKGALVRARVGRGTYTYTGLSMFRQLPAGVPGAVRLFVNLITPDAKRTAEAKR